MTTTPFLAALATVVSPQQLLRQPVQLAPYESDALTAFRTRPLAVVLPNTQDEVIALVRLCHEYGVPFVARGSGTSLSGGSLPVADGIVIGLNQLNRIVHLDPAARLAVAAMGVGLPPSSCTNTGTPARVRPPVSTSGQCRRITWAGTGSRVTRTNSETHRLIPLRPPNCSVSSPR